MLIENEVLNVRVNEVLSVKVVGEQNSDNLRKKLGDFCFGAAMATGIALFAEGVFKKEANISFEEIVLCMLLAFVFFISGVFMYKKGGL